MRVVFSIGGSVLAPEDVDRKYLADVSSLLLELSTKHQLAVVVGGGKPARRRIAEARSKGASWAECDHIGVLATRDNARALVKALGAAANNSIPETIREAAGLFGSGILVMGGTEPGHSTDAVAALLADWVKADLFINASNVDAVYDRNPVKFKDAKPLKEVNVRTLLKLLGDEPMEAGKYQLLDLTALKVIERSRLKTIVLDGRDLNNMKAAAEGRPFKGTTIIFK